MIRKISGKNERPPINHLIQNNTKITDLDNIVATIATTFRDNFSDKNYTEKFKTYKIQTERHEKDFDSDNSEVYNKPFSISELNQAINISKNTAAGIDDVPNQVLKMLPERSKKILLRVFNDIWESDTFPELWKEAIIVPIAKPNKDSTDPSNYRPISLTCCLCKIFERMINNRLVWFLESNDLFNKNQGGFRKGRTTMDQLVKLETFVREGMIKGEHVVTVFFDLEKAYDTAWKYGVLRDLKDLGLKGHLPKFISNFLADRRFRVRLGNTTSDPLEQEEGYPQGSILSVVLFLLKINSINNNIRVDNSIFVDDFCISFRGNKMHVIERQLQGAINNLISWADTNGFRFSKTKTVCMHFCHKRKPHPEPKLTIGNSPIPVVKETKYLGLIFDNKLSFIPHIKYLKSKCQKDLNLLRVLSAQNWGADRESKVRLYRAFVRSKIDYGCIVYGSARPSYLKSLEPIQNQALRIALNAFRTSPKSSLCVEANEPPLHIRRLKLSLKYACKLHTNPQNPLHEIVFNPTCIEAFQAKPNSIPSFGVRILPILRQAGVLTETIATRSMPLTPPWQLGVPTVNTQLHSRPKAHTPDAEYITEFNLLREEYHDYYIMYTDGSKCAEKASAAVVTALNTSSTRLPNSASIFSAECKALLMALNYVKIGTHDKVVIFTDYQSFSL